MNCPEWLALLLASAAVGLQIFAPPVVGLANNNDFAKIIGQFDVGNPSADRDVFRFVDLHYAVDPKYHYESKFYSSELLLFAIALGLAALGDPGVFDLRLMGAVHAGVFLLAFYLVLPVVRSLNAKLRFVVVFLILLTFTDVMYVSYFDSFFMDTAAFLFLLLSVVFVLRALLWRRRADRYLFVIAAVLLITSKTQHYLLGIPIALLLVWKGSLLVPGPGRVFRTVSAASVLLATAFSSLHGSPSVYPAMGSYTVIFLELLPQSNSVSRDLKELGLDDSYRRYIGTHAYSADAGLRNPQFEDDFRRKHFYTRIAWFLLKHPSKALDVTVSRMDRAGLQRPNLGNFAQSAGFPEFARSRSFAIWSDSKARVFGMHGGRYLFYSVFLALSVSVFAVACRHKLLAGIPAAIGTLAAMMLIELLVASFADAVEAERHYSLFSALTDLLLLSGACLVPTWRSPALSQELKQKLRDRIPSWLTDKAFAVPDVQSSFVRRPR